MKKDFIIKLLNTPSSKGGMKNLSEKGILKRFPDVCRLLFKFNFPTGFTIKQMIYHYINDDTDCEIGICDCGKRCRFLSIKEGYSEHCSVKCSRNSKSVDEKRKSTCLKKYGVDSVSKTDFVKSKRKQTFLNRYGVEHPMQSSEVKERVRETNLERYGVENVFQSVEVKERVRETNLERYGVENVFQTSEVKENAKRTNIERYGVEHPMQSSEVKERVRETNLERYGVENVFQTSEVKERIKETNIERYGVEHPMQSNEVKERVRKTNLERYGVENVFQTSEVKERIKETNIERYGVENVSQCDWVKRKTVLTNIERYGVEYPMQSDTVKDKARNENIRKYGVKYITQSDAVKNKIKATNLERYGVEWFCQTDAARNYSNNSKPNLRFAMHLDELNIEYVREFPINNYSYDFKVGKTLIEVNPTITHNSVLNIFGGKPKDKDYHLNKSKTAKDNGYFCIHVWDWDDKSKIVNMVKPKKTLYARNLELREVEDYEANDFLNSYHLQDTCKGHSVRIGLYIDDILVQLMTFGKPRYNKNYEWELLRLCTHSDYMVVGGAERLFRAFVENNNPKSVISYCDNSKFNGTVYERLGFEKKSISNPTRHWYNLKTKRHITDNFLRQRGFDQLFGTNYGKGTSNDELMIEYGFLPVYDCGQSTYVWTI